MVDLKSTSYVCNAGLTGHVRSAKDIPQGIENPRVGGSIPSSATISKPSFARLSGYHRIHRSPFHSSAPTGRVLRLAVCVAETLI